MGWEGLLHLAKASNRLCPSVSVCVVLQSCCATPWRLLPSGARSGRFEQNNLDETTQTETNRNKRKKRNQGMMPFEFV
jgi:hypothetical protein